MRNLVLGILGLFLLALQVNAKQTTPSPVAPATPAPPMAETVNRSTHKTYSNSVSVSVSAQNSNQQDQVDEPKRTKTYSKSFNINRNDKVNIASQFGSVVIKTWDKNEVKMDADIKVYASTDAEADKLLDNAVVSASKEGDVVSLNANVANNNGEWGSGRKNGKRWRREVKVLITIYMPATNPLSVSQQFGNVTMDDFSGPTSLKVQYGDLITGDLKNINNYINMQYGKANLQDVNQAKIKQQYGDGLTIATIGYLNLDVQFAGVRIGTIKGNADIRNQYGDGLTIGTMGGVLNIDSKFTSLRLTNLQGNLKSKNQNGKVTIANIETGAKIVDIDAQFTDISLSFSTNYNADFSISTSFGGGFKYASYVTTKKQDEDDDRHFNPNKNYSGQIGKGGSNKVTLKAQYGSVSFK